jgi:hypothetical protein
LDPDFVPDPAYTMAEAEAKKQTTTEWAKEQFDKQYEKWVPWLEDLYLKYFTKDNKASYATKREQLSHYPC